MGIFRRKKPASNPDEPVPEWNDTRWRSLLRAHTTDIDHHCNIYLQFIKDDRKEAARLFKNDDTSQARSYAESSLRHHHIVEALATLSSISNNLYQRTESLAGYTTLFQIPEPARSGIVSIIFVAGRLHMKYLSETVNFLRQQFGPVHVDAIQKGEGELYAFVNHTVRESLSPGSASQEDIDAELESAVREYFGMPTAITGAQGGSGRAEMRVGDGSARGVDERSSHSEIRRSQTTPVSVMSSEMPVSPQISDAQAPRRMTEEAKALVPGTWRVHGTGKGPRTYHGSAVPESGQQRGYHETAGNYAKSKRSNRDPEMSYNGHNQVLEEGYGGDILGRSVRGGGPTSLAEEKRGGVAAGNGLMRKGTTNMETKGLTAGGQDGGRTGDSKHTSEGPEVDGIVRGSAREVGEELRLPEHLRGFKDSDEMLLRKYDNLCGALLT
eukprot:GFKZ01008390.1.p1 GENE.GFKZ01008390.1~~GFKZ01008390.1.p1  ORF type:complete len:440 (+),score=57.28 GFKZ01008390.1:40-1359(+)